MRVLSAFRVLVKGSRPPVFVAIFRLCAENEVGMCIHPAAERNRHTGPTAALTISNQSDAGRVSLRCSGREPKKNGALDS